jgi:hypothetical protein
MDCQAFERLLLDFQQRLLKEDQRLEAERHLQGCPECRLLLALWDEPPLSAPGASDMTMDILARTSGPACPRLREQACAFVDGELDEGRSNLVRGHLEHCGSCSALVASLVELKGLLPQLASLDPGPAFTQEVLRRSVRLPAWDPWTEFQAFWRRLFHRPRFCFEAAYAGTLAGVLVLNVPLPKLQADKGTFHMTGTLQTKQLLPPILDAAKQAGTTVLAIEQRGAGSLQEFFQRSAAGFIKGLRHQGKHLNELQEGVSGSIHAWLRQVGMKSKHEESTEPVDEPPRSSS